MAVQGVVEGTLLRGTVGDSGTLEPVAARLLGTSLLWQSERTGAEEVCQRVEATSGPIDAEVSDPFAGTWVGAGIRLVLEEDAGTYMGTLTVAGATWSVLARANGRVLWCTVATQGETGRLTATLSGQSLLLSGRAASATLQRASPDSGRSR